MCARPSLLRIPLKFTPFALQRQLLQQVLSWQFRRALADGDLEFLESRWLKIEVRDLALQWFMTVENDKLVVSQHAEADVSFSGDANDLILIAARKQDPDTLFFSVGCRLKGYRIGPVCENLMDAIELESMPAPLRMGLLQLADFVEAGLQEGTPASRVAVSC